MYLTGRPASSKDRRRGHMMVATTEQRITRDDLERAFSKVVGEGEATARDAVPPVLLIAGAIVLGLVAVSYMAGRRRGRRRSTFLEIRRF